jgi:hypothetical protein
MSDTSNHRSEKPVVERKDRYNIVVNGHTVRADAYQEHAIREMDAETVDRFLRIMGRQP